MIIWRNYDADKRIPKFDLKLKLKFSGMIFMILFGAAAELLGVSMILPIVTLATDPQAVRTN